MLPALNLNQANLNSAPLLVGSASAVIGVEGRVPSVLDQGAIESGEELEQAVAKAKKKVGDATAIIALVADVKPTSFRALTIYSHKGQLRLYDTTYNSSTLGIVSQEPLIKNNDLVYTWDGVLGIGKIWFEITGVASATSTPL